MLYLHSMIIIFTTARFDRKSSYDIYHSVGSGSQRISVVQKGLMLHSFLASDHFCCLLTNFANSLELD